MGRMRAVALLVSVVAGSAAAAVVATAATTTHADDRIAEHADPVADAASAGGDIVDVTLNLPSATWGIAQLRVVVDAFTGRLAGTYGPDQNDHVAVTLEFDSDGDGGADRTLRLATQGPVGIEGTIDSGEPVAGCYLYPGYSPSERSYVLGFSVACLPSPSARWRVDVSYDNWVTRSLGHDRAPDAGWWDAAPTPSPIAPAALPASPTAPTGCVPRDIGPAAPSATGYAPLTPARLMDTRPGESTIDCAFRSAGIRPAGSVTELDVSGRGGVPADAIAAVLDVVTTGSTQPGYVTVFPCGTERPLASNVNYSSGETIPNAVLATVGAGGRVCFFTSADVHLVVDVMGAFAATSGFHGLVPARVMDTRPGQSTVDGALNGIGQLSTGSVTELRVTGRAGVPVDAASVVLNVTATESAGDGYLAVFPCGAVRPLASNVNFRPGASTPNAVVTKVSVDGSVCVFANGPVHVVVDVNGWIGASSGLRSVVPARLLETRTGGSTVDGRSNGQGPSAGGATLELVVAGRGGVPTDAAAVVLNVTVTEPVQYGYVVVYPCGAAQPVASNLNFGPGSTVANVVVSKVGAGGAVCLFSNVTTHLIADVNGYVASASAT